MIKLENLDLIKDNLKEDMLHIEKLELEMKNASNESSDFENNYGHIQEFISGIEALKWLEKDIASPEALKIVNQLYLVVNQLYVLSDLLVEESNLTSSKFALKVCNIDFGDIIEFTDNNGWYCALSVKEASLERNNHVYLSGPRVSKAGKIGDIYKRCIVEISSVQSRLKKI